MQPNEEEYIHMYILTRCRVLIFCSNFKSWLIWSKISDISLMCLFCGKAISYKQMQKRLHLIFFQWSVHLFSDNGGSINSICAFPVAPGTRPCIPSGVEFHLKRDHFSQRQAKLEVVKMQKPDVLSLKHFCQIPVLGWKSGTLIRIRHI